MIRLSVSDSYQMWSTQNTYGPHLGATVYIKGTEDNGVILRSLDRYGNTISEINVGDYVHINMMNFSDYHKEMDHSPQFCSTLLWAELRQFKVLDMYSVHESGYYSRECYVILQERDRQNPENDGQYWMFFCKGVPGTSLDTTNYLSKIGNELTEEAIENAKQKENRQYERRVLVLPLIMCPSDYVQKKWEVFVKSSYYNKTYGKAMLKTVEAFPDADPDPNVQNENEESSVLLAILWGFVPEGYIGFMYLLLALFFSACTCIMDTGWFIIICIIIIYWCSNIKLKTNRKF